MTLNTCSTVPLADLVRAINMLAHEMQASTHNGYVELTTELGSAWWECFGEWNVEFYEETEVVAQYDDYAGWRSLDVDALARRIVEETRSKTGTRTPVYGNF